MEIRGEELKERYYKEITLLVGERRGHSGRGLYETSPSRIEQHVTFREKQMVFYG